MPLKTMLYLPLDERPCNWLFPQMMTRGVAELELLTPPKELLGRKKTPADLEGLWAFVEENFSRSSCAVLSAEMLFLGGLLPSRLHHMSAAWIARSMERLRALKESSPETRLYLFELIMRTPRYSSSDEEPDYYQEYGERIFRYGYLKDKQARQGLDAREQEDLHSLANQIPPEHRADYEARRNFNAALLENVLELVRDGVVELLYIPQDDSCEFGYTAIDQKRIHQAIRRMGVEDKVYMHPGADEAGAELVARAWLELTGHSPRVYVKYGSPLAAQIIPLYEDRILGASVEQHLLACGCERWDDPWTADLILAVNAPGRVMQESADQQEADVTYQSFRCLRAFVKRIGRFVEAGKPVAVADCAYANGGDLEFLRLMDKAGLLEKLVSYKGWNTNCNTLGTTLAQGVFALAGQDAAQLRRNLLYHLLDDGLYQALVRAEVLCRVQQDGLSYFDLGGGAQEYGAYAEQRLLEHWRERLPSSFSDLASAGFEIWFPWNRLFEIGITWRT